ncbi:DNA primase [Hydrogeniiclostridium mannosilyticum]|uniref:DNA primase n=1 Tax=Hydrogeniiclostridium mannosilyticum TaxID=2764322 RepID=UPI00399AC8B5
MPLPDAFLQELKVRNDLTDVVSSYVNLRRSGRNMVGLCPFHGEKTPSFNVYPENGSFYCFGCGVGGDVITFIRRIENLDYMEAVRFLADRSGLQVPENDVDRGLSSLRTKVLEINRETARFFHRQLMQPAGKAGLDYLTGRGLSLHTIKHFGLGYAPENRKMLVSYLQQKGYTANELIQANVAFQGRSGAPVDRFSARVMFPIIDLRGNVIGFSGRVLTDVKPKYLNTSETLVFHKSNGLFAMNFAKNNADGQLILAEGNMDVISLHQAGFTNAVASLGTSLTPEQAHLMAKYAKEVVICYDADAAGQKATARAIPLLRNAGLEVRVLNIPNGKDPDEYIRSYGEQGSARFRQLLTRSGNDIEYRISKVRNECNLEMPEGRVAYLTGAVDILASLDSDIERDIYAGRLAEETGVAKDSILSQVRKKRARQEKTREQKEFREFQQQAVGLKDTVNPEKYKHLRAATAEEALIAYLLRFPEVGKEVSGKLPSNKFVTSFNSRVYEALLGKLSGGKEINLTDLSADFSPDELSAIAKMIAAYANNDFSPQAVDEFIQVILQEKEKESVLHAEALRTQDIQQYLDRLKAQKK